MLRKERFILRESLVSILSDMHYYKVVYIIKETIKLMKELEKIEPQ